MRSGDLEAVDMLARDSVDRCMATMTQFWVFGYGSLMWNPGFAYVAAEPALIHGYHRALCVLSHIYRGTQDVPGLVLGLDRGGSCHGVAFRVDEAEWPVALAYLRAREQVTMVYVETDVPARLLRTGETVNALTYVVDRGHQQYARHLSEDQLVTMVRNGVGKAGSCRDYVISTADHLRSLNIEDRHLEGIVAALGR